MNITELAMLKKMAGNGGGDTGGGGAYIIELSGSSFNTVYQLTDEQKEQMNNNFANVLVHLTVDGILYVLTPLAFTDYPNYAITSIDNAKLASCVTASLLPNYGLWVGKTDVDLANVGGGLSIKKIEFTDRPSAFEWLVNNNSRVIKTTLSAAILPAIVNYGACGIGAYNNDGSVHSILFTNAMPTQVGEGSAELWLDYLRITGSRIEADMEGHKINVDNTTVTVTGAFTTPLPDEYWSEVAIKLTCYYID